MRPLTRHASLPFLSILLVVLASLACAPAALAGSYWWTAKSDLGQIARGVNGFDFLTNGGSWDYYGSHCDARPATYVSGSYCYLRWNVPAGLTAGDPGNGGLFIGRLRFANANFSLRTIRPGGNPDYTSTITGPKDMQTYQHGWGGLGAYVQTGMYTTASTTPTSTTNWFDVSEFRVVLHDPSTPGLNILEGHSGWKGAGGACVRYGFGDGGSGIKGTSLSNVNTGAVYDAPSWDNGDAAPTTGVFQTDRTPCFGAPGTGHYTIRAGVIDKSNNYAQSDFVVSFDTTAPTLGAIQSGGTVVNDGRVYVGSAGGYRPSFSTTAGDAHSGLASVQAFLDGAHVANAASYAVGSNLSLGTHTIMFRATDAVGNQAQVTRTFTVVDDVQPTVTVAQPAANGSNEPVLDVTASDDHAGVNANTWTVTVNGVQMPASGTTRLQMNLGRLVNGTHAIVVKVKDNAGNERVTTIQHVANKDTYTGPTLTGLHVVSAPSVVYEGSSFHVVALAAKNGRPLAGQRFELVPPGSSTAIAGKNATADGSVDMLVENAVAGPLTLAMPGSGLATKTITYTFHAKASEPFCTEFPQDASCQKPTPPPTTGGNGSGGSDGSTPAPGGTGTGGSGSGTGGNGDGSGSTTNNTTTNNGGTTNNVTNVTNIATSGLPGDKVPPKVTVRVVKTKAGVVRRTKRITLRITSNERANYTIQPVGNRKATRVNFAKAQTRTGRITVTGALLKRIQRAKTKYVLVAVKVVGIDGNKNVTRKTIRLRVLR